MEKQKKIPKCVSIEPDLYKFAQEQKINISYLCNTELNKLQLSSKTCTLCGKPAIMFCTFKKQKIPICLDCDRDRHNPMYSEIIGARITESLVAVETNFAEQRKQQATQYELFSINTLIKQHKKLFEAQLSLAKSTNNTALEIITNRLIRALAEPYRLYESSTDVETATPAAADVDSFLQIDDSDIDKDLSQADYEAALQDEEPKND